MASDSAQPQMGAEEVGVADAVFGERGRIFPEFGVVLRCSGSGSLVIWVRNVSYVPVHWEDLGWLPPQAGPQTDRMATTEGTVWYVVVPPTGRCYGEGRPAGGVDLRIPPPEHSFTENCNQVHYGPVSGGGETPGDKCV